MIATRLSVSIAAVIVVFAGSVLLRRLLSVAVSAVEAARVRRAVKRSSRAGVRLTTASSALNSFRARAGLDDSNAARVFSIRRAIEGEITAVAASVRALRIVKEGPSVAVAATRIDFVRTSASEGVSADVSARLRETR